MVGSSDGSWVYGFINRKGEVVIDYQFCYAKDFQNGAAWVKICTGHTDHDNITCEHLKTGTININGNWIKGPNIAQSCRSNETIHFTRDLTR